MWKGMFSRKKKPVFLAVTAPLTGEAIPLQQVPDPVFSQGLAGAGVAIRPADGRLVSPVNAQILHVFPTGHAVGLRSDEGVEFLLHIGIDTVRLAGAGFQPCVQAGDRVAAGDLLVEFDREAVMAAGLSTVTPVVITNREVVRDLRVYTGRPVEAGKDPIMDILLHDRE